jgi:hypothetical protein
MGVIMNATGNVFIFLSIGLAILALFGILNYLLREKYAASINKNPEAKQKILESSKQMISLLRIFLWLSPLYLILLPWLISNFTDLNWIFVFICMALISVNVFVEYLFRKWLYQYLLKPEIA